MRIINKILRSTPFRGLNKRSEFKKLLCPNDTFIVAHPKSGNTWISRMLSSLLEKQFQVEVNLSNIQKIIPAIHAYDLQIKQYAHFPSPRLFRNEGPVFPKLYPQTIYIIRDPRAVYVSYYHHCLHDTNRPDWKLDDFVDELLEFGCIRSLEPHIIRWDKQVAYWLERSKSQKVKIVKYEDLKKNPRMILEEMVSFIGIQVGNKDIDIALERGTFENMRKEEVLYGAEPYSGTKGEKGFFTRKGKVDGWKEELSLKAVAKIQNEFSDIMNKVGYQL